MDDAAKLATCIQYLRRTYYLRASSSWNLTALRAIATAAFAEASEQVTIIGTGSEAGGTASGQVTFDKWILIAAVNAVLEEADPDGLPAAPPSGSIPDFSCRPTET
jgi:hypothetical protein